MALVTSSKGCFHCEDSSSTAYKDGWRLRSGKFAQLCNRCGSLYEEGRFCDAFHTKDEGWRDCESCGKLVHCGCIASFNTYLLMDFGGIICMSCSRANFITARKRCLYAGIQMFSETQADDQIHIDPLYCPRVTDAELREICGKINSAVVPLFEKFLSVSDADQKLGRLVIPKSCAEAFFPEITQHGCPMKMLDTDGREWVFHFRHWLNDGTKMFVLEGLKEYMVSMQWQPGDLVNFYRVESDSKLVIGSRKSGGGLSSGEGRYVLLELGVSYIMHLEVTYSRLPVPRDDDGTPLASLRTDSSLMFAQDRVLLLNAAVGSYLQCRQGRNQSGEYERAISILLCCLASSQFSCPKSYVPSLLSVDLLNLELLNKQLFRPWVWISVNQLFLNDEQRHV